MKKLLSLAVAVIITLLLIGCPGVGGEEEPTYTVSYDGNGQTGGSVPADGSDYREGETAVVAGNTGNLVKSGYKFCGWNSEADCTGTCYTSGDILTMPAHDVTLYANWVENLIILLEATVVVEGVTPHDLALSEEPGEVIRLPLGMKNLPYKLQLKADGGDGEYDWELYLGALPPGLELTASGCIQGTPTVQAENCPIIRVSSGGLYASAEFCVEIVDCVANELTPAESELYFAVAGELYYNLDTGDPVEIAFGGGHAAPFDLSIVNGSLPPGLDSTVYHDDLGAYLEISGIPEQIGTFSFTVRGEDDIYRDWWLNDPGIGNMIEREYSISVY